MLILLLSLLISDEDAVPPVSNVGVPPRSEVALPEGKIEGELKLPQGFSTLSVDAVTNESYLKERLNFNLWEASKLGY